LGKRADIGGNDAPFRPNVRIYSTCLFFSALMLYSEHLRSVPDLLETLMSEKRLLQASVLLVRSLKIINKPEMLEIGAVSDLRSYLNAQETASLRFKKLLFLR
jgi:hypothetical protein